MRWPAGLAALLAMFWLVLSGHYTGLLLALAVVSIGLVVWLTRRMHRVGEVEPNVLGANFARYLSWLFLQIMWSAVAVSRLVWRPRLALRPQVGRTPAPDLSEMRRVIYANSITVTPGTLAMSVDDEDIEVHSLDPAGLAALQSGGMLHQVRRLEVG